MTFALIIGIIAALVLTVLLCVKVIPQKYDGTFSKKLLQTTHDYFNFKKLYLESVLKFIFTLATVLCIVCGIMVATLGNVFNIFEIIGNSIRYDYFSFSWIVSSFFRNLLIGLGVAVLAPIALRLVYEGILMFILLVKNVIEINNKIGKKSDDENL